MEWVTEVKTVKRHMVDAHEATFRITSLHLRSYLTLPDQIALLFPLPQHHPCRSSCMKREAAEFGNEIRHVLGG